MVEQNGGRTRRIPASIRLASLGKPECAGESQTHGGDDGGSDDSRGQAAPRSRSHRSIDGMASVCDRASPDELPPDGRPRGHATLSMTAREHPNKRAVGDSRTLRPPRPSWRVSHDSAQGYAGPKREPSSPWRKARRVGAQRDARTRTLLRGRHGSRHTHPHAATSRSPLLAPGARDRQTLYTRRTNDSSITPQTRLGRLHAQPAAGTAPRERTPSSVPP